MTKKHFIAFAKALSWTRPSILGASDNPLHGAALDQWRDDVEAIIETCQQFNHHFDTDRFKHACGVED